MDGPNLIDPSARYFLYNTLQKCHDTRVTIYTYALNIGVCMLFVGIIGAILYYNYKSKLSPAELQQKMLKDQQYILSKIRYYQGVNQERRVSEITNLPTLDRY